MSNRVVEATTTVDILRWRATHHSEQCAYTFLVDGETEEEHVTYAALDRRACGIAARLHELVARGDRVLLLYPPGLEYIAAFFGCLYAGAVAVPAYPPHPGRLERSLPRLRAIIQDARPLVALTTSTILSLAECLGQQDSAFQALRCLATDQIADDAATNWRDPGLIGDTLAFLQYTSGSTATPKGVMLTHRNLLANAVYISHAEQEVAERVGVFWLPPYHDLGLIGGIIQPLYYGDRSVLMSPMSFLQQPLRWLRAISHHHATHSAAPNFAYDLCVRKITPEQRATLDLSSWCIAYNGAEPIRKETLERFATTFKPCGFRSSTFMPCYGLAESTLMVSAAPRTADPIYLTIRADLLEQGRVAETTDQPQGVRTLVGSGRTWLNTKIMIVRPDSLAQCATDEVGEIWVSSPSIAQGYWNRPEETQRTFHAYLADTNEGPFLRTADLGFIKDGELFVTGRLKDLIIAAGRNIYPEDLEQTTEQSHPLLRPGCCAAFSVDVAGEEQVVIVQEVERRYRVSDREDVVRAIRRAVMEQHDLGLYKVVLLKAGRIPKTSSGKIQRHACREGFLAGSLEVAKG